MKNLLLFLTISIGIRSYSQSNLDSLRYANIQTYYSLAMQYKDGNGVAIDFSQAYRYFQQAANLGDAQSIYAYAYLQYKGLGCTQDYVSAAKLFAQGARQGRDNSMYFYGLCWRNGYGLEKNLDSARYWLQKSANLGYRQASQELLMVAAENANDSAKALVQQVHNAAIPKQVPLNKFTKVVNTSPDPDQLAGSYRGWLIQYDWSGQNVVIAKHLVIDLGREGGQYKGIWLEGSDTAVINASLLGTGLKFNNSHYARRDHYSPDYAVAYDLTDASVNMVRQGDSLFLAGSVSMFSPDRKEPSKPILIALVKVETPVTNADIGLRASPSPFTNTLNVEFTLPVDADVEVQLLGANGAVVYRNSAGKLSAGHYVLPLQPGFIAPGVYMVKVAFGNRNALLKVVRS